MSALLDPSKACAVSRAGVADGLPGTVNLYDRLFTEKQLDGDGRNFLTVLKPNSLKTVQAIVEPSLASAPLDDRSKFERHGFVVADRRAHQPGGRLLLNRIADLNDSWRK